MICNGLRRSEAYLIADDRKHRRKMFPYKTEAIADKRTTNPLRSEEKTYFKSDWTCFKENNSVSPIGHRSYQTHVSIKTVIAKSVVMVRKVELDSTFPITQTLCRRSPQTPGSNVSICLRRGTDLSAIVSQTDRRPLQIIWKPGFTAPL